jgi:hypothetical protein
MTLPSKKPSEGVGTSKASDLRDTRQGAYDSIGNQKTPDDSAFSEHERQHTGGSMQGEPIPAENFEIPGGLKRQPMGPYNRDKGRSDKVPDHVPKNCNPLKRAMTKSNKTELTWRIFRRRFSVELFVGIVRAPNPVAAVEKAIQKFQITDTGDQLRLFAQPRDI